MEEMHAKTLNLLFILYVHGENMLFLLRFLFLYENPSIPALVVFLIEENDVWRKGNDKK